MCKKPYYITTAIAYTSGKPHIGNTYEIVLADSIARYKRMQGFDVRFQTGTDEHGQKIEIKAAEAGITPKEFVDNVAGEIKRIWDLMNTSYDKFIRTTDTDHEKQVQKIFKKLYDKGDIYKGAYEGMYCTPCESFWTESQLKDGKCPDCGREVKPAKEEAYFFRMSKYADRLIEHINTHPEFIQPASRKNEMRHRGFDVNQQVGFLDQGHHQVEEVHVGPVIPVGEIAHPIVVLHEDMNPLQDGPVLDYHFVALADFEHILEALGEKIDLQIEGPAGYVGVIIFEIRIVSD